MTFGAALKRTLWPALLFAVVFSGLSLVGDRYWERSFDPLQWVSTTVIAFGLFWAMTAHRRKVKSV